MDEYEEQLPASALEFYEDDELVFSETPDDSALEPLEEE
jgi:hypothetical protein